MDCTLHIGVDVAKDELVVACAEGAFAPTRLPNHHAPLLAWLASLPPGSRIGVESTGAYHERLVELACAHGFVVFVLNPKDLRHYARAVGRRGKTDRIDAELIARYLCHEHPHLIAWSPPSHEQRAIRRLLKRRAEIARARGALVQSLKGEPALAEGLAALQRQFSALLDRLDAELARLAAANAERQRAQARLDTILGVGSVLSTYLATLFERIPFRSAKAFVAFTGLDPRPDDSGHKIGRRRRSKRGPAELRRLLFLAALCWSRGKTAGRALYEHDRAYRLCALSAGHHL